MSGPDERVRRIALFGRGRELWPVAALLSAELPGRIELVLVEEPGEGRPPAGLALPWTSDFHDRAGIDPAPLVAEGRATIGLGTVLRDWQGEGSRFFSAASGSLPTIDGVALHQVMLRAARLYEEPDRLGYLYEPFRFCARAALAGKLALGSDSPASPRRMLGPTLQCDADDYAALCRARSGEGRRVTKSSPAGLRLATTRSELLAVSLENGEEIQADFFVDLSGALSALVPESDQPATHRPAMAGGFDRVAGVRRAAAGERPHRLKRAIAGGILVETALGETGIVELFGSSAWLDEQQIAGLVGADFESAPFEAFACDAPWTGNLVRLGPASARLGPHLAADTLLLVAQALDLAETLPARREMPAEAASFNARHAGRLAQIGDFGLLPLLLNRREEPFWRALAASQPPETLALRLDQFRSRGRLVGFDREMFDEQSWIEMLIGFGIVPERCDRRAEALDMPALAPRLKALVERFDAEIAAMPAHDAFLRQMRSEDRPR